MLTNLHIYSGLGNVIAIIDAVRSDISIDSTHVTNIVLSKTSILINFLLYCLHRRLILIWM